MTLDISADVLHGIHFVRSKHQQISEAVSVQFGQGLPQDLLEVVF